jgi:ATP-dependent DNA helicase RecG
VTAPVDESPETSELSDQPHTLSHDIVGRPADARHTGDEVLVSEPASSTLPRPVPGIWQPIRDAISYLSDHDVTEADAPFVHNAAIAEDTDWSPAVLYRAWALLTGRYRPVMEDGGWDVDMLPVPDRPTTPAPERTASAPGTGPAVILSAPGAVTVTSPVGHPLRTTLTTIPGATWNSVDGWTIPITRRTASALRHALTGYRPTVAPDAAAALRTAADSPAVPDITIGTGKDGAPRIELRFEHTNDRRADVMRLTGAIWDGPGQCWATKTTRVDDVLRFAEANDFLVGDDVHALLTAQYAPFDYDGTIDGLRGVPVTELVSVTAKPARGRVASLASRLADFGITSVYDLLTHVPIRYMDRDHVAPLARLAIGDEVGLIATVTEVGPYVKAKRYVRVKVTDGSANLTVTFFNAPYMAQRFRKHDEVTIYGRLDVWDGGGSRTLEMRNPIMDPVGNGSATIIPVYPQSPKNSLSTWDIHVAAMEAVRRLGDLADPLPEDVLTRHDLLPRAEAYKQVHHPDSVDLAEAARTRLAFDELFRMQLALGLSRRATADETGVAHAPTGVLTGQFTANLAFDLTGAQQRAMAEIVTDLRRPHPMHRLLQGDVGSGKTMVALLSLLSALEGGFQGALMAPTEILATQLHTELAERLTGMTTSDGHPIVVEFLGGKTKIADRRRIYGGLTDGSVHIVVGTHALLTDEVHFANLGLVVIDEQHRFGVEQRATLRAKGPGIGPDVLLMTATPIPRTSAMTVFGDLDISVLDELPPGRTPIETTWLNHAIALDGLGGQPWDLVRDQVDQGHQAYVVASLVEDNESETQAAQSATEAFDALGHGALHGLRLGLVHGKMKRDEREATMRSFKDGEIDVLIATTVIEVGVNVPNATVMVVLDPGRFGIAQLHQIRGRVGRGRAKSYCVLAGRAGSADGVIRMNALVNSTDGFYLSEVDLALRGTGSIFGTTQAGASDLRVADLQRDKDLIGLARNEVTTLLDGDPRLSRRPGLRTEMHTTLGPDAATWFDKA